jgi:F0F1-type ATP synthase membrane subunit b/b'
MAGAFELVPNPTILVVQTGMFFAAAGVVKKLYVDPYLKLKAKRDEKTSIANIKGSLTVDEFESKKNNIKSKLNETRQKASQAMDSVKKSAELEREKILAAARESLEKESREKLKALSEDFRKENEKVGSVALASAEKMAKILLG